jgi:peptidyl-prolyl cis-trans isomerase SurA
MLRAFTNGEEGEAAAIEQLIDERLMIQEAQRRGIGVSEAEVDAQVEARARGAGMTGSQFRQVMRQSGFDPETFEEFLVARIAWQRIVQARFRATVSVSEQDVAAALDTREVTGEEQTATEYMLQQIIFVIPSGAAAGTQAQRQREAVAFRDAFQSCDHSIQQAGGAVGIVVKPPVRREESQLTQEMREVLAAMNAGGITGPDRIAEGLQLIAICAKNEIAGQTEATTQVREEIANERGELLARRYLRDLRSDAVIEYR